MDPDNNAKIQKLKLGQERFKFWTAIIALLVALISLSPLIITQIHNRKESDSNKQENSLPRQENIKDSANFKKSADPSQNLDTPSLSSEIKKKLKDAEFRISIGQEPTACEIYIQVFGILNPKLQSALLKEKNFVEALKLVENEKFIEAAAKFEEVFNKKFSL